MPKPLHEAARTLAEATQSADAGLLLIEFITPGWGSSGYYSRAVVEAAAPLFAAGTHMYFDHATEEERRERPGRSVLELGAVLDEDGYVDPETGGIVGKVRPLRKYADLLTDEAFASNVGVSISGSATDIVVGEAEGRRGPIVEGLAVIDSVDFVTRAGRGGRVRAVLESARATEATANDTREALSAAIRAAHGGEDRWLWVRDFDDTTVWFEIEDNSEDGESGIYAQTYTLTDGVAVLTGTRTKVRVQTSYVPVPTDVPVTRPGGSTTEESQEDTMPNIQIEESEHARLVAEAGRVTALEERATTAEARAENAENALAESIRRGRAMDLIREHEHSFSPLEARGLVVDLPLTEAGDLDEAAFTAQLTEHAAAAQAAAGVGKVTGFGQTTDPTTTESARPTRSATTTEAARPTRSAFGRPLNEQKGA